MTKGDWFRRLPPEALSDDLLALAECAAIAVAHTRRLLQQSQDTLDSSRRILRRLADSR